MRLTQIIEALLFASDAPLSAADLLRVDERLDEDTVEAVIQELRSEYEQGERSFQIYEVAGGYQLLTRPEFVAVLERYDSVPQPSRLSAPALEVLAIIAYRQPIGRVEIEDIRGVGSSGVLRTLTERNLVEPVARGEGLGRPLLYGTTKKFLEHFGFRSLEDLPRPDELPIVLRERPSEAADAAESAAGGDAGASGEAAHDPAAPAPAPEGQQDGAAAAVDAPDAVTDVTAEATAGEGAAAGPDQRLDIPAEVGIATEDGLAEQQSVADERAAAGPATDELAPELPAAEQSAAEQPAPDEPAAGDAPPDDAEAAEVREGVRS